MKKILKEIKNSTIFPFILFFIVLVIMHIPINNIVLDDVTFSSALENQNIIQFLQNRYYSWSSRSIIEFVLVLLLQINFNIWKILNIAIFLLLAKSISKLANYENNQLLNFVICFLILVLPYSAFNTSGWVATTTNYLWVAALGIYSISMLVDYVRNKKISFFKSITYFLATLYASNHEQMSIFLFLILGGFLLHELCTNASSLKKRKTLIISFIIVVLNIVFILTCPGNYIRKTQEISNNYPEFIYFNILEKLELAILSTMDPFVWNTDNIFIIFTFIIFIGVFLLETNRINKILALIPLASSIFYTFFMDNTAIIFKDILVIHNRFHFYGIAESLPQLSLSSLIVIILYIFILFLIPFGISLILKNNKKMFFCNGIYFSSLIVRFIIGFSPTIFVSGIRTFLFTHIGFIICSVILLEAMLKHFSQFTIIRKKN